jgi:uncharacterized protein YfaS (alpha-2-macroglobulin family)
MLKNLFSTLWKALQTLLIRIFGHITWNCPPWLDYLCKKATARSRLFWFMALSMAILIIISLYGYSWYQKRPQPELVIAHINTPKITPLNDEQLTPESLSIDFGTDNGGFTSKSVAPIQLINKEITTGITMTPALPGKWFWESDSNLVFYPESDWPAEQTYHLDFNKSFFAAGAKMAKMNYTFTTQTFQPAISQLKFYQDPINPKLRAVVATLNFNFPVDPTSLEKHTTLMLQALSNGKLDFNAQQFKYTITSDKFKRTAYLHSEPLPLPDVERYLELSLSKGIKALIGPGESKEAISQQVLIPDAGSYFKISSATASIVRNDHDQPEQILTLESTIGVTSAELNKNIHIYLLPMDYPATSIESAKENYQWQNPGEVTPAILALATPLDLQTIPPERDYATLHSYKFNVEEPRYIYLKIDKGARGFGDYILTNDYATVIKAPEYPKEVGFLHKGALLSLSGEKKLSITVRGIPAVKFAIARVLPDNINQLVTQTDGTFSDPHFLNYTFNENNISEIFSEIKTFDPSHLANQQYTALDLGKYLAVKANTGGPMGLFLLKAQAWDNDKNLPLGIDANRLILITDLGLVVKDNKDGSHDIFVQAISTGKPVANATISVLGKNGLSLINRTTDNQGHANLPTLIDFVDEHEPTVYLAKIGNDVSFIPYNNADRQLNYSRFDIGGLVSNNEEQNLTAFIFTERGVYRPGDTAHIAMIVKQAYANAQPAGLPLEMTITDPRGVTVQDQKITLDATGYLAFDLPTTSSSPTGQYTVNLFIIKDNHPSNLIGSTTLRVAEFLPDRMRITAHLSVENAHGWIHPAALNANVSLMNLYGAPAAHRKISARLLLTPQTVKFPEFPKYTFIDPLLDPKKAPKVFTDNLPDTESNDQGQAAFNLNLERFDKATYQLTFFTEGFESEGGRSVSTQTTALVSPLNYLVGYKPDGDLNFIKQNEQRHINFIAVNPELKQQNLTNLQINLYQQHPISTLVKKPDGTYQYQSVNQTTEISSTPFTINAATTYNLPTDKIGNFYITITDATGTELSHFNYIVVGTSQQPLPKNAELNLKLKNTTFAPDQDIEMEITSPYTGSGLITIERDKVYAYQWFKADTTSSIQKIHIPKDFQGDGYVNVTFVRDWNSPDIFMSPLSYAVAPFTVSHANHDIHIDLNTPTEARPGDALTISYKTDKPSKIIVFAVDEGILQVTSYKTPNPSEFFFQKRALEVVTQQIVDQIIPKFIADRELSTVGGDEGKPDLSKLLNPFKRKTDLPVVYWSGILDADTTPHQVTYTVPDYFNGSLRVMAVAAASDAVGSSEQNTLIRGDFIINPNAPTFVAPGDEFEVTASIANNIKNSGKNAEISIKALASPQLEILEAPLPTIKIDEGTEQTIHIKLRAKEQLGSADITFVVNLGDKSSKMTASLSIRPATAALTTVSSGFSTDKKTTLTLDRTLYPENRAVDAVISTNPLILVVGLENYLNNFPYGCTEQLVSKAFPLLAMEDQPWYAKNIKTLADKIQLTMNMLLQRQLSTGGFSYWPSVGDNYNNSFASVYAMHFLTEARGHGYSIPNDAYSNGIAYLNELARQEISDLEQARIQAYAIYVLTRNEIVTTNYLTNLQLYLEKDKDQKWQQDITAVYIAATYELLKNYSAADKLINSYKPQTIKNINYSDFYNTNIANAQYLYLIARHFPDRLAKYGPTLISSLVSALNSGEMNTIFSSYASLALSSYAQSYHADSNSALGINEILSDGTKKSLAAADSLYQNVAITDTAKKIEFDNPNKQAYFYQLTQTGFDKNPPNKIIKESIEVYREYRDSNQNIINTIELGKELEVHIRIRALNNNYLSNIAIMDLLPGGFEIVTDSVAARMIDYFDIREDRILFFGSVGPESTEIVYHIKPTNKGQYIVPPITAISMYNPAIQARSEASTIAVTN